MGEAEVIDFGSRGQATRARRRAGRTPESQETPTIGDEDSGFESEEVPRPHRWALCSASWPGLRPGRSRA
jgi:hypothetical protein